MTTCNIATLQTFVQKTLHEGDVCVFALPTCLTATGEHVILSCVRHESMSSIFIFRASREDVSLSLSLALPISRNSIRGMSAEPSPASTGVIFHLVISCGEPEGSSIDFTTLIAPDAGLAKQQTLLDSVVSIFKSLPEPTNEGDEEMRFSWVRSYEIEQQQSMESLPMERVKTVASETGTEISDTSASDVFDVEGSREVSEQEIRSVNVLCATWNVNGKMPPEDVLVLDNWLLREASNSADIVCIGLQEVDLSTSALVLGGSLSRTEAWAETFAKTLKRRGSYFLLETKQLVGVLLFVFIKGEMINRVGNVQTDLIPCGVMGVAGNKGGVAIRFTVNDNSFCVVNSHLNAHTENVLRRNQDFHDISEGLTFKGKDTPLSIYDHDFLFWIGDLNYRIPGDNMKIREMVERGEYAALLNADQLLEQKRQGLAFSQFTEANISFAPTFKYDMNSTNYDTSSKMRSPAWCDRVLWKEKESGTIANIDYIRAEVLSSDHRPVSASFIIQTRAGITKKRLQKMEAKMRERDAMENSLIADISLSETRVDLGLAKFDCPTEMHAVKIQNKNTIPVSWSLQKRPGHHRVCKPWLNVVPTEGTIAPGETAEVNIQAHVTRTNAAGIIQQDNGNLTDIIIIHLDSGKDYFVDIAGKYQMTCLGLGVEQLVCYENPVSSGIKRQDRRLWIPKEVWRVTDELLKLAPTQKGIFSIPARSAMSDPDVEKVISCLDSGEPFKEGSFSVSTLSATLLLLLDNLANPLIPPVLYEKIVQCASSTEVRTFLASQLEDECYTLLFYILSFLRHILKITSESKDKDPNVTPENLAHLFAPVFTRDSDEEGEKNREMTSIVYRFITDSD